MLPEGVILGLDGLLRISPIMESLVTLSLTRTSSSRDSICILVTAGIQNKFFICLGGESIRLAEIAVGSSILFVLFLDMARCELVTDLVACDLHFIFERTRRIYYHSLANHEFVNFSELDSEHDKSRSCHFRQRLTTFPK